MKPIKFLLACILLMLAFVLSTQAQTRYVANGALPATTFTVAATAGTNVGLAISCPGQASVPVRITLMADASGAYEFRMPIQYSLGDGVTANMASSSVNISFNGVTAQTIITNIPTHGCTTLVIPFFTNVTAAINVTNGVVAAAVNTAAPGAVN